MTQVSDNTVGALYQSLSRKLAENSISQPKESIETILAHCLGTKNVSDVHKDQQKILSKDEMDRVLELFNKRMENAPIEYVLGECHFRNLVLKMMPPVFVPWPETPGLIDHVLRGIDEKNCTHALEFCCGSGAISLALLDERKSLRITTLDLSPDACKLTEENARRHNLQDRIKVINYRLTEDNLDFPIKEKFDVIVSNPPYVPKMELTQLPPEMRLHQDLRALNGGQDGLDVIKLVIKTASSLLNAGGRLFLEIHPSEPCILRNFLDVESGLGLTFISTYKDYHGEDRYAELHKI